jgi:hypothetical protein
VSFEIFVEVWEGPDAAVRILKIRLVFPVEFIGERVGQIIAGDFRIRIKFGKIPSAPEFDSEEQAKHGKEKQSFEILAVKELTQSPDD